MAAREERSTHSKAAAGETSPQAIKQRVREHFSSVSGLYHEKNYLGPVARGQYPDILMRHRRILEMVQGLEGRALDVGCGSGRLLLDLQRAGFEVAGVDFSPAMVEASRSLLARHGSDPATSLSVGDIERLEFEDGRFDLVVAAGVIEYLAGDDAALAEMRRVLRPGGTAVISVRNRFNLSRPLILLRDLLQDLPRTGRAVRAAHRTLRRVLPAAASPYWPDVRYHVPWRFVAALERHGFRVEEKAFYHFAVCPPLLRRIAPRLSIRIGLALEGFSRTFLGHFAGALVVKARRMEPTPRPPSPDPESLGVPANLLIPHPETLAPAVVVRLGVTGLGLVRSLSHRMVPARIPLIAVDAAFSQPAASTRLCERRTLEELDAPGVIDRLIDLAQTLPGKPVLFLTDDATVLRVSAEEDRLRPHFRFLLPPPESVRLLADKTRFAEYAVENGFRVPQTVVIRGDDDLVRATRTIPFPVILKPAWRPPVWEQSRHPKAFVLERPEELRETYRAFAPVHPTFVVQEWIPGPDSEIHYCLVYFDARSRCLGSFTGRKIRQWPCGAGNTSITEPVVCPEVERETMRLFEAVGFRGLGSVEFKRDPRDGLFKIMEPTVGRPNLQSEVATVNGTNLAWLAYADASGIDPGPRVRPAKPVRWVHEYTDLRSGLRLVAEGKLSLREWLRSYRGPKHFALFSPRDLRPFVRAGRRTGIDAARRVLGRARRAVA